MAARKQVIILAILTVVAVIAAAAVLIGERSRGQLPERAPLFPDLDARFEDVMRIEIADKDQKVTITRDPVGGWVLPAADGYPADRARVRQTLLSFARMRIIEPKTTRPEHYERLGVRDLKAGDSRARLVRLLGPDDGVIAAILIGDAAGGAAPGGQSPGGDRAYLRKPGEAQTWLAEGVPQVEARLVSWFDDRLVTIGAERIAQITVRHADGEVVTLSRPTADDDWTLAELPRGRALKTYGGAQATAASLAFLVFDDVRTAAKMADGATRTTLTTFDGLTLSITMEDGWAHFAAATADAADDVEQQAADINARLGGWDYKLPDFKLQDLAPALDDLLEPLSEKDNTDL